jgi:hypothetical protein
LLLGCTDFLLIQEPNSLQVLTFTPGRIFFGGRNTTKEDITERAKNDSLSTIVLTNVVLPQDTVLVHIKTFYDTEEVLLYDVFPMGMPVKLVKNNDVDGNIYYKNAFPIILIWGNVGLADSSYNEYIILPVRDGVEYSGFRQNLFNVQITLPFNFSNL